MKENEIDYGPSGEGHPVHPDELDNVNSKYIAALWNEISDKEEMLKEKDRIIHTLRKTIWDLRSMSCEL